jgi:hypothetical protein
MKCRFFIPFAGILAACMFAGAAAGVQPVTQEYMDLQARLCSGWNTFDVQSVLSQVLLPEGFCIGAAFFRDKPRKQVKYALIGKDNVWPGPRTQNGTYAELTVRQGDFNARVESAALGDSLVILVTPLDPADTTADCLIWGSVLWGRPGTVERTEEGFRAVLDADTMRAFCTGASVAFPLKWKEAVYSMRLREPVGVSTHKKRTVDEIQSILAARRAECLAIEQAYGALSDVYAAVWRSAAWNQIYEREKGRLFSIVSRFWATYFGGYVIFCWDTYFASLLSAPGSRDLAYANAVEITHEITKRGFVPNYRGAGDRMSYDRSQPPVGSLAAKELYRRFKDRWFLEEVYGELLTWNRWWKDNRQENGFLCWGTNPLEPGDESEGVSDQVNAWQGAAWESGLDNSPMFDDAPFDTVTHLMEQADVGLMSLYIMDCEALAEIADELGHPEDAEELRGRAGDFRTSLQSLWSEEKGLFLNKRMDTGRFSERLSPTLFYPLLADAATADQAQRMVDEHLLNPSEFWGDWTVPSCARNDSGYNNNYWRGRIWGPMNFLVYTGLRRYDLGDARRNFSDKSRALLLGDWLGKGRVYENYNADTGTGEGVNACDPFYHWGALLGLISLYEEGFITGPEHPMTAVPRKDQDGAVPRGMGLYPNYPNPFNPATVIPFEVASAGRVRLDVMDLAGRTVRTLADRIFPAGSHLLPWDGTNAADETVAAGVYVVRMRSGSGDRFRKMVLLK